jgi:hypothetical protein
MRNIILPVICLFFAFSVFAQTGLSVAPGVRIPEDPAVCSELLGGLQGWLAAMHGPDSVNAYVAEADRPATSVLMHQMRSLKGTCYVGGVTSLGRDHWQVQLNYLNVRKDTPVLEACCTVLARREGGRILFESPLGRQTVGWKRKTIGCCTFYYATEINLRGAVEFERRVASYDRRLKIGKPAIDYYCCTDFMQVSKLVGIDYMARYAGFGYADLSGDEGTSQVIVCGNEWKDGFCRVDPHDLWHGELHRAVSTKVINRPVDEGMAYLYGGSWFTYEWKDILKLMKEYRVAHPGADWLALYKEGTNVIPPPKIIKISYIINALIVQRLERDRGFAASLPLLCCGPKQDGDANYFAALRDVAGVDEKGFNAYIDGLVKDAL